MRVVFPCALIALVFMTLSVGGALTDVLPTSPVPATPHHRWTRPPGSRSSILAKICISQDPTMKCKTNCSTYAVQPKQCFDSATGQTFEFNCIPYPSCIDGTEYMNTTCAGNFSLGYRAPCNSCQRGRLTTCSGNNVTHYSCGEHDFECKNITGCRKVFEGTLGQCSTINMGFWNVSVQLPASRKRCSMVRVDQFFNSACDRRHSGAPGTQMPHHHRHWSPMPTRMAKKDEKAMEEQGKQGELTFAPHEHRHHSNWTFPPHHHHWPKHMVYYLPANKCESAGAELSVEFTCKSAHHQEEQFPEATPEVMEIIQAHLRGHSAPKRLLGGHHSFEMNEEPKPKQ